MVNHVRVLANRKIKFSPDITGLRLSWCCFGTVRSIKLPS